MKLSKQLRRIIRLVVLFELMDPRSNLLKLFLKILQSYLLYLEDTCSDTNCYENAQHNKRETPNELVKAIYHQQAIRIITTNTRTSDLTWFGKSTYVYGEEERNVLKTEKKITSVTRILSLTTFNGGNKICT